MMGQRTVAAGRTPALRATTPHTDVGVLALVAKRNATVKGSCRLGRLCEVAEGMEMLNQTIKPCMSDFEGIPALCPDSRLSSWPLQDH